MSLPFTWTLKGHFKAINWPNICVLGDREARGEVQTGNSHWWSSQNTQNIYQLSSLSYLGVPVVTQNNYKCNIKDHESQVIVKNNNKNCNTVRIIKMWHSDMKWANAVAKMLLIDLLHAGLPQAFNLLKNKQINKKQYLQRIIKCSRSTSTITELSAFLVWSQFLFPASGGFAVGTGASVQISPE